MRVVFVGTREKKSSTSSLPVASPVLKGCMRLSPLANAFAANFFLFVFHTSIPTHQHINPAMALPRQLKNGLSPREIEFLAENEMIEIAPAIDTRQDLELLAVNHAS